MRLTYLLITNYDGKEPKLAKSSFHFFSWVYLEDSPLDTVNAWKYLFKFKLNDVYMQ